MLNITAITGRMVETPELKTTQSGVSVSSFRMAHTRNYKNADGEYGTDFFNVVAWRNTAEFVTKHFKKGDLFTVSGRFETRNYTDKDGNKRVAFELIADSVYFGESKRDDSGSTESNNTSAEDGFDPFADSEDDFPEFPG